MMAIDRFRDYPSVTGRALLDAHDELEPKVEEATADLTHALAPRALADVTQRDAQFDALATLQAHRRASRALSHAYRDALGEIERLRRPATAPCQDESMPKPVDVTMSSVPHRRRGPSTDHPRGGETVYIPLRIGDVNIAGHIGNAAIPEILDHARTVFLGYPRHDQPGYTHGILELLDDEVGRVIGQQTIEYRTEMWYAPDPVAVTLWITHIGTSSFSLASTITPNSGREPAILAEATIVLIDRTSKQPWVITERLRQQLDRYRGRALDLRRRSTDR